MDPQDHPDEIPAQLFRDSFRAVQIEMYANALSKQVRDFAGERSKRFKLVCSILKKSLLGHQDRLHTI